MENELKKNREEITVRGKDYTIQKLPTKQALDLRTKWIKVDWDDLVVAEDILKYWVVSPEKLSVNDFDVIPELMDLVAIVITYQYGEKKTFKELMEKNKDEN